MVDAKVKRGVFFRRGRLARTPGLKRIFSLSASCRPRGRESARTGLLILQIDGLGYSQFLRALKRNRLPFIRRLLQNNEFAARPFYSGVPSTTPAVQAELFFGVKTAVPAFQFIDRADSKKYTMAFPWSAEQVANRLEKQNPPLLKEGRSYSNIYIGGAAQARYCAQSMQLDSILKAVNPLKLAVMFFWNIGKMFKMLGYAVMELLLASVDFVRGVADRRNFFKELKFIPTRIFICIILRELIRLRVKMDVAEGIPVIHANFTGYDEQAHRRNPRSAFAHWTLKGIDAAVKDIWRTARQCGAGRYHLIVYSDHGQEAAASYKHLFGKPVENAIREALDGGPPVDGGDKHYHHYRMRGFFPKRDKPMEPPAEQRVDPDRVQITSMGPIGHIYLPFRMTAEQKKRTAELLTVKAGIPLTLYVDHDRVKAATVNGTYDLLEKKASILGADHPFLEEAAADLYRLCRHTQAGDLVISGWRPQGPPITFAIENGAHGGPGKEETRGFIMLPRHINPRNGALRALDLRKIALDIRRDSQVDRHDI